MILFFVEGVGCASAPLAPLAAPLGSIEEMSLNRGMGRRPIANLFSF